MKQKHTEQEIRLARFAKAMGHPTRIAILNFLASRNCCFFGDIHEVLPVAKATVSQHLSELKKAGLIQGEIFPPKVKYCINPENWELARTLFEDFLNIFNGVALFAGGCFWGVEYYLQQTDGVLSVTSGYTGGHVKNPTYQEVCAGKTGHAEVVKVIYNPQKTNYETLVRLFLEIHDPTQLGGQGPDIGNQYRSEIFYLNDEQQQIASQCIQILKSKGFRIVTAVTKATAFYPAETYHQDYYFRNGNVPYCHSYVKRF